MINVTRQMTKLDREQNPVFIQIAYTGRQVESEKRVKRQAPNFNR